MRSQSKTNQSQSSILRDVIGTKGIDKHLFSFFNAKMLSYVRPVCKELQTFSNQLIEQTKNQIVYAIGNPIVFGHYSKGGAMLTHRKVFENELVKAFPSEGEIFIFLSEEEAMQYCNATVMPDDDNYDLPEGTPALKSAYYQCQYLGKFPLDENKFFRKKIDNEKHVRYFPAEVASLLPISGKLDQIPFKLITINFANIPETKQRSCLIC